MKAFFAVLLFLLTVSVQITFAQRYIDKVKFFQDTSTINATLTLNLKKLLANKSKEGDIFPAVFSCKMGDSLNVNDRIFLEVRGHFRREYCYIPPIRMICDNNKAAAFYHLKVLKLVNACSTNWTNDQNLLKEFIIYKIYNLITDKSFRVRLLNLNLSDSAGKKKTITQHAFLLEDIKQLAKRNNCVNWTSKQYRTEATDRRQMTIVAIFEYLIGNTDWAVPVSHNIKLLHSLTDSLARPYVVPYDFDYSGFVNAPYAVPDEKLGINSVRERLYRGFPRNLQEINEALTVFNKQKKNIYAVVNNFSLLTPVSKKDITDYLDEFYLAINDPFQVKATFITGARKQ